MIFEKIAIVKLSRINFLAFDSFIGAGLILADSDFKGFLSCNWLEGSSNLESLLLALKPVGLSSKPLFLVFETEAYLGLQDGFDKSLSSQKDKEFFFLQTL